MKIFTFKDSSGEESTTLFFVAISWFILIIKYLLAGATFHVGIAGNFIDFNFPQIGATEYGIAVAGIIGIWLGHNWINNKKDVTNVA